MDKGLAVSAEFGLEIHNIHNWQPWFMWFSNLLVNC